MNILIKSLTGHTSTIRALEFFPNNKFLVSGSDDGYSILTRYFV